MRDVAAVCQAKAMGTPVVSNEQDPVFGHSGLRRECFATNAIKRTRV